MDKKRETWRARCGYMDRMYAVDGQKHAWAGHSCGAVKDRAPLKPRGATNETRQQRIRKGQTPPKAERRQTKNAALSPSRWTKNVKRGVRGVDTWIECMPWMDKNMHGWPQLRCCQGQCFALPLRLPLRQGRGVGGYRCIIFSDRAKFDFRVYKVS